MPRDISKLRPWKPGQSGNPSGMPKIPDHLRSIKSLTQHEVTKTVSKYARMTRAEIQTAISDSKTPMLEIAIASVFAQSAKNGDYGRLNFLLDRAVGKVPVCDPTAEESQAFSELREISDEELLRRVKENLEKTG